jgi:hypothetical protein
LGELIRPKRIYFPEHFCYCFSSNLCVLNTTNMANAVFSRIALMSCFCAEIQLSGKNPENTSKVLFYQKTHGARRRDGEGLGATSPPGGVAQAWPHQGVVRPPQLPPRSLLSPTYTLRPETIGGSAFFPDRLLLCHHHQKP